MFCGAEVQRLVDSPDEGHVDNRKWWQRSTMAGNAAMRASASAKRL